MKLPRIARTVPRGMQNAGRCGRQGLTLQEVIIAISLLAVLTTIVVASLGGVSEDEQTQMTQSTLRELQSIIANRYMPDMGGVLSNSPNTLLRIGLPGPHPDESERSQAPQLAYLFVQPGSDDCNFDVLVGRGWRGPYVASGTGTYPGLNANAEMRGFTDTFGEAGDQTLLDAWGNPIVVLATGETMIDCNLVSAGPDGDLATTSDNLSVPVQ